MNVVALAGGIGAARFLRGLVRAIDPAELTVIANTGDDITLHGLHVSPDLDTICYTLGGGIHHEQGWGRADEHFTVATELRQRYGAPDWFTLGDRDLATHLVRTEMMRNGVSLSDATTRIADAWDLPFALVPMTDDPVATIIETDDDRRMHFQEWWVGERAASGVRRVVLDGAADARTAPVASAALDAADLVVLCPSNPVVSIGTILQIAGVRDRLVDRPVVGVSPIVGGDVVRGMADKLLPVVGAEVSATGVAGLYADFLDGWVIDTADQNAAEVLRSTGLAVAVTDTIMADVDVTTRLASAAVDLLAFAT